MINKKTGLMVLLASLAAGEVLAGTFNNYTNGDVLICFRNGGSDLVVDAGPISTFTNLTANQRYTITTYTGGQLGQVGTNGTSWSAFTWLANNNTLFVTRPRTSLNTQTAPWKAATSTSQGNSILRMATIPLGATDNLTFNGLNTSTAVLEEDNSDGNANYPTGSSYHSALSGAYGANFNGYFQGNPEYTTLNSFTSSGTVVRSDFYQITPNAAPLNGKLLGYFELNTNGVMTYVAYPSSVPVFKNISRAGNVTTIDYTTGLYGTYSLRGTNSAGLAAARTNWPVLSVLTSGDTAQHTTTDTTSSTNRFYTITAQ